MPTTPAFSHRRTFFLPADDPADERVLVRPAEIDDILVNPGMGIQTFQRFAGHPLDPGKTWSEAGPTETLPGPSASSDAPPSSMAYLRWFWSQLEPAPGDYRWDIIDRALAQARARSQTLALRLMPYDPREPLPAWYRDSGARRANRPDDDDGHIWQPDFADPRYLEAWGALVAAFGARYDGHPDLELVDISSVGYWGEGWSDYMPSPEHQRALIDIWFEALPNTLLVVNFDEPGALRYGTERGAGWRLDCLGDMRGQNRDSYHWNHMLGSYPQQVVRTGIQEVWKRRPVVLEVCWVLSHWYDEGWDVDYILDQALRWHVSALNIKSSRIPPAWRSKLDAFQKRMGYRLLLRQASWPRRVVAGAPADITMWWLNAGVAPMYRPYRLALAIDDGGDRRAVIDLPDDVRTWLPGDAVVEGPAHIPASIAPGRFRLRLALLDPRTGRPAIRLAIDGRQPDGWYDLGPIEVVAAP